jgi:F0F1-type ATP synthase delta subunit
MDILNIYASSFLQTCAILKKNIDTEFTLLKEINEILIENVDDLYTERYFWKKPEGEMILEKIIQISESEITQSFLNVLYKRSDIHLLNNIVEILTKIQEEAKVIEITVNPKTSQKDLKGIIETVKEIFGNNINKDNLKFNHSEDIVAGFTLKFDSIMVDFSYAKKIEKMKHTSLNKLSFS